MEITKQNLRQAIAALRKCADENRNRIVSTGAIKISDLCDDVANYLEKDSK
jgi:DNA-binding SARP family transcriptional activator